jgi:hypothetical protein
MASTIAAITTGTGGVVTTADATGNLSLLSGATTVVAVTATGVAVTGTLSASGVTTLANGAVLGTPASGNLVNCTGYPVPSSITRGTAVASTSGTSITFSSIPSGVKRITIMYTGISTNVGGSSYIIQVGSGSVSTSGYSSQWSSGTAWGGSMTTGIAIAATGTSVLTGTCVLDSFNSNIWVGDSSQNWHTAGGVLSYSNGVTPNLAGALDRVVITTVAGTATFATGTINILYE